MQQLVLGTAQWGDSYGITNQSGRLSDQTIQKIADLALNVGISAVDTAAGYGDAETRLASWARSFSITSKIQGLLDKSVSDQIQQSLSNLGIDTLTAVLVHDWPSLPDEAAQSVVSALRKAQDQGLVTKVGVSAYDERDLIRAIDHFGVVDAVQLPLNILDRRLIGTDALNELISQKCDLQVRSVFLQGLLAADSTAEISHHPDVRNFHETCDSQGLDPLSIALGFVQFQPWVSKVVVGVTSADELQQIHSAWTQNLENAPTIKPLLDTFVESKDLSLIDPREWAK